MLKEQMSVSRFFVTWKVFYAFYDAFSSIAYVYISAQLINAITKVALQGASPSGVYRWLLVWLALEIFIKFISLIEKLIEEKHNALMELHFNSKLIRKMYELSQEQFEDEEFLTKISRATDGLSSAQRTLSELTWIGSSIIRLVSSFSAVALVSPIVAVGIVLMSLPGVIIRLKMNKYSEKIYRDTAPVERITYRTRWVLVDPQTMPEIRLANGFSKLVATWKQHKQKMDKTYFTMSRKKALYSLGADILDPATEIGATYAFFRALVDGRIGLDRFLFVRGLLQQMTNAAFSISYSIESLDARFIELENFKKVLDANSKIVNGNIEVARPLSIEFKNVSFRYPNTEVDTLKNISFIIVPGSKLALVGENGAGKSTLLKLLLRLYLPTEGEILINGVNIADIEIESYYRAISNLSQDFIILSHLSVEENVALGIEHYTNEQLNHALQLAGADEFISKLKHGLETKMDSSFKDGKNFSGGQTQRLAVARSLLRNGDLLVLDEPTSAIDAKAEYKIFNNIYAEHTGKTTLIVSHRFSTVRKADKIMVMEQGRITEYGSHEELLEYGKLYKEMFETQAEGYR